MEDIPPHSSEQKILSSPEENLQAIRELAERNEALLTQLLEIQEKQESRRKWKIVGNVFIILFPYLLMGLATWYLYMQITTTIDRFENAIKSVIPEIPESWSEKTNEWKDKISEQDWKFWGDEESPSPSPK